MVKFAFKEYESQFPQWSKHHKKLSSHVRRVYEDGEKNELNDEKMRDLVNEHEELLISKNVTTMNSKTGQRREAMDYYLPLYNTEYEELGDTHYSVGSSNTSQETGVRLHFKIEESLFILDHSFKSSGSYAVSFIDLLDGEYGVLNMIEEILEQEKPIEEVGIELSDEDEESYHIVASNEMYVPFDFEIEKRELLKSLVGMEVYKFDLKIND